MAFGFDSFTQAAQQAQQQQVQMLTSRAKAFLGVESESSSATPKPGTLYIHDTFVAQEAKDYANPQTCPHGLRVAQAARQQGFQGTIVEASRLVSNSGDLTMSAAADHIAGLQTPGRSRDQVLKDIQGYANSSAVSLLDEQSSFLDRLTTSGAKNSVANISLGESKANRTAYLFYEVAPALYDQQDVSPEAKAKSQIALSNISNALGIDQTRLMSGDPEVAQPERNRLAQGLIDQVSQGMDGSVSLMKARTRYNQSVAQFEDGKNSVVVSAGNEGDLLSSFQKAVGGPPLNVPRDFAANVLENEAVTTVGAMAWQRAGNVLISEPASYSNKDGRVDIYATGSLDRGAAEVAGTSFSAPRVASTLAEIHHRNPQFTSAQAESMLQKQLSYSYNGSTSALSEGQTSQYLASNTF